MNAIASFIPLLNLDGSGFTTTEDQSISPASREIFFGNSLLPIFLLVVEWRAQLFARNYDHGVHRSVSGLSRHGKNHGAFTWLRSGQTN
jgi:hypothetical protein